MHKVSELAAVPAKTITPVTKRMVTTTAAIISRMYLMMTRILQQRANSPHCLALEY